MLRPSLRKKAVFILTTAPARAARSSISRSSAALSTTWALGAPASNESAGPSDETMRAPLTVERTQERETLHSSNAARESSPAHWTGIPADACSSTRQTESPCSAQSLAHVLPAGPPPTTTASNCPGMSLPSIVGTRRYQVIRIG